jgi:CarD family transcriptional regulator
VEYRTWNLIIKRAIITFYIGATKREYKTLGRTDLVYKIGDYVICQSGGIWKVLKTSAEQIVLSSHECGEEKILPVTGDDEIVRSVANKEDILEAISRICFIRTIQALNDKVRRELYDEAMSKFNEIEWIKVIKSAYLRGESGRFAQYETEYAQKAKKFFHGEISAVMGIPVNEVEDYISSAISSDK